MNLILVPLNRFEVNYEVVKSEPYGEVHRLLLESISTRPATLETLQELFQLPPRMLIEVLVNLFYDGWVTVTSEGFRLTQKGRTSLKEDAKPSNYLSVTDKTYLMMERISGGLIHRDDIAFDSKGGLRRRHLWDYATQMPIEYHDNRVDAAQAKLLIRERGGGWIRQIQQIQTPAMNSAGDWHWLPVDVDTSKGEVVGLPGRWKTLLQDRLLTFAMGLKPDTVERRYWDDSTRQRARRTTKQVEGWSADFSEKDFISGTRQHCEQICAALKAAQTSVLVTSSVLGRVPSELRAAIDQARARGIMVDLFWGRKSDHDDTFPPGYFLNDEPSDCRANLLLYDTNEGYIALVGSYPWLAVPNAATHSTVVLRHPGIVADVCHSAATIIEVDDTEITLSDVPLRWKDAARKLETKAQALGPSETTSTVRIIRDQDHAARLHEYLVTAQQRWAIFSPRADDAVRRLEVLSRRTGPTDLEARVCIQSEIPADETALLAVLEPVRAVLRHMPRLGANAVIADTSVLVSGYEFLGGKDTHGSRAYHVGVAIDGGPLADEVWKMTME